MPTCRGGSKAVLLEYLPILLRGTQVTVLVTLVSIVCGGLLSFTFGVAKLSSNPFVRTFATTYIEFFRGTSLLVQLFWLFYALPLLGVSLPPFLAAVLALSLNTGAYGAEVVRGALQAVPKTQLEAALALNFTPRQILWRVSLPQAVVEMMPPLGNLAVETLKSSALVSLITLSDLSFVAENLRKFTQDSSTIYSLTLVIYFVLAMLLTLTMRYVERRLRPWVRAGGR
jgi:polar amino acid transport system permease protein